MERVQLLAPRRTVLARPHLLFFSAAAANEAKSKRQLSHVAESEAENEMNEWVKAGRQRERKVLQRDSAAPAKV